MASDTALIPDHFRLDSLRDFLDEHARFLRDEHARLQIAKEKLSKLELNTALDDTLISSPSISRARSCSALPTFAAKAVCYEPIVPNILSTKSGRQKADEYKRELLAQIEDKKRRVYEQKEREMFEDMKRGRILHEQQMKLLQEFQDEHRKLENRKIKRERIISASSTHKDSSPSFINPDAIKKATKPVLASPLASAFEDNSELDDLESDINSEFATKSKFYRSDPVNDPGNTTANKIETAKKSDVGLNGQIMSKLSEVQRKLQEGHRKMIDQLDKAGKKI